MFSCIQIINYVYIHFNPLFNQKQICHNGWTNSLVQQHEEYTERSKEISMVIVDWTGWSDVHLQLVNTYMPMALNDVGKLLSSSFSLCNARLVSSLDFWRATVTLWVKTSQDALGTLGNFCCTVSCKLLRNFSRSEWITSMPKNLMMASRSWLCRRRRLDSVFGDGLVSSPKDTSSLCEGWDELAPESSPSKLDIETLRSRTFPVRGQCVIE